MHAGSVVLRRGKPLVEVLLIRRRVDGEHRCEVATAYNAQSQVLLDAWAVPGAFEKGLPPLLSKAFGFHDKLDGHDKRSEVYQAMQDNIEDQFHAKRRKLYEVSQCHQNGSMP